MGLLLLITSLTFYTFGVYFFRRRKNNLHEKLSSVIMFVAGTLYLTMGISVLQDVDLNLRVIRYFDWILTVPILTYQMFLFLHKQNNLSNYIGSILCIVGMLVSGWLGEIGVWNKVYLGVIGTMFSIYTFVVMANGMKKEDVNFFLTILVVWMFYPIVYFIPDSIYTIIGFSIVDVIAKIGSSIYIKNKIQDSV